MYAIEIECLKGLYEKQMISKAKIESLFAAKKITECEKNYILGKE